MPHFYRNAILSIVVLVLCAMAIYPPERNLRLGKDLAGGVSLVYTLEVKDSDPADIVAKTIEILKDRLNPDGLYEMSFTQQGRDRVEITMPLPNDKVKALRAAYEAELSKLREYQINIADLERVLRLRGAERDAALNELAKTDQRRAVLGPVLEGVKKVEETQKAVDEAKKNNAPEADLNKLVDEAGAAAVALDEARSTLVKSLISPEDVRDALELPNHSTVIAKSGTKNETSTIPSPRDRALEAIRERIKALPGAEKELEAILVAHAAYVKERRGFDDPADLERLLQGAGILEWRIAVQPGRHPEEQRLRQELQERGPEGVESRDTVWRPINKLDAWFNATAEYEALIANPAAYFTGRRLVVEQRDGKYFVLLYDDTGRRITKGEGTWKLESAFQSSDQLGKPAVGFRMDPAGANLLGNMTETHKGEPMAIVLDDQVISAPNINDRIANSGIIQGNFSQQELDYLIKTMSAGSLQAKLSSKPISKDVQAPDLGKDNLDKGLKACWYSFIVVGIFMVLYYFIPGGVAVFGMIATGLILLGIMALQRAAFSLPGIAGVALTFGMAVDSNVLIYERLREEVMRGNDIKTALRLSYQRALSTIVDSNLCHLITCVVLAYAATKEIKGFAVTLGIGVVATMFMSLVITRVILVFFVDYIRMPHVDKSLPRVFPWVQRLMTPHVDWLGLRHVFFGLSGVMVVASLFAVVYQGKELLGLEFRGGTAITITLKEQPDASGKLVPMKLPRAEIAQRIHSISDEAEKSGDMTLRPLINAEVVAINPEADGVTSDRFTIKTAITDEQKIRDAVVSRFRDIVESRASLSFKGAGAESELLSSGKAPVHQLIEPVLGQNIGRPEVQNNIAPFVGGVGIVLQDLKPEPSKAEMQQRLDYFRNQADYSSRALKRNYEIVVLDGTDEHVKTAAILVRDPGISIYDEGKWREQLAQPEWNMIRATYTQTTLLASIQNFSGQIADTFKRQALVATMLSFMLVMVYVWMRFGTFRHSLAAIVPLFHDVAIALGFIAISGWVHDTFPFMAHLGIRPFKIDLGLIAAVMTIIGYSINDTIIILDRIRENQGKLAYPTREIINNSINQTMSRTFITSGTVLFCLIVLLIVGGEGLASFAYAMTIGVVVGTYSSFAIAAPFVWVRHPPAASGYKGGRPGTVTKEIVPA